MRVLPPVAIRARYGKGNPPRPPIAIPEGTYCVYCRDRLATTLDHVIPRSRGGSDAPENIVPACAPCNSRKGSMDAEAFRAFLAGMARELSGLPGSGHPFHCPACGDPVYIPKPLGGLHNVRAKGQPRTKHTCRGFSEGHPNHLNSLRSPAETTAPEHVATASRQSA